MTPHAVVIAAGLGTRLRPLTDRYAKAVLPIDGKPVLALLLRELAESGFAAATVVTGHFAEQVERLVGDGSGFGLEVSYARQASPDGSAHAVLAAAPEAPYVVLGADKLFERGDVGRFAASFAESGASGAIAVEERPRHRRDPRRARRASARTRPRGCAALGGRTGARTTTSRRSPVSRRSSSR